MGIKTWGIDKSSMIHSSMPNLWCKMSVQRALYCFKSDLNFFLPKLSSFSKLRMILLKKHFIYLLNYAMQLSNINVKYNIS